MLRYPMLLKTKICSVLKVLGMHSFNCERCGFADECEGRYMRERLQELSRNSNPAPEAKASSPARDNVA